jgi:hypothetical protein
VIDGSVMVADPEWAIGTTAVALIAAAARPAARVERIDTVIRIAPWVVVFAAGLRNYCTFSAAERYTSERPRAPDARLTAGTTVVAMPIAEGAEVAR